MKVGDYIKTLIRGQSVVVKVLVVHGAGTVDVLTKENQCFRITGLGV